MMHIFQGLCICVFLLAVNISFSFSEETDLLVPFASTAPTFPLGDRHPTAPQRLKTAGPVPTHTFGRNLILGDGSDPVFTQPYTIRAPTQRPFGIVASHTDCRVEGPSVANDKARARFYDVPFEGTLGMTAAEALNSTAAAGDRFEITYMDSFATHLRFSLNDSNVSPLGGSEMRVPLVRGMAYVTTEYTLSTPVLFSSTGLVDEKGDHIPDGAEFLLKWSPLAGGVKMAETLIRLDTGQTWVCYLFASAGSPAPSALRLMRAWGGAVSALSTQTRFSGVVRLAKLEEERGRETSSVVALRASLLRVHAPAVVQGAQIALRANASLATLTVSWSAYTMGGSTVQPLQFALPHHLQALGILTAHTSGTGEPISPMRQATTAERAAAAEVAVAKGMKSDTNLRPGRLGAERALEAVHREMQMAAADEPLFETRVETGFKSIRRQNLGDFDLTEEAEIYSVSESEKKVEATHLWLRSTTQGVMRAVVGSQWVMPETLPFARATGFLPEGRIRVETIPALLDALDLDLGATGAMQSKRIAWAVRTEGIYTSGRELWRHAQLCLLQRALLPLYPTNSSLSQALTVLANATHANTKPTIGGESVGTPLSRSDAEIRLRNSVGALAQALDTFPRGESGNPFVREQVWGGVVGSLGLGERSAPSLDFGSAWYHDHLAHFGYIIAAAAALESLSPGWAVGNRKWVDTLARDVASPVSDHFAPQLRHTDLFDGHAWSLGLFHSKQGRELESVSEEIHGYYALSLWGKVTGRVRLERLGRALLALATRAHRNSFFMTPPDDGTPVTVLAHPIRALRNYVPGMSSEGRIDYSTWTRAGPEYIHGIQMLPVSPALVSARTPEHAHAEWVSVLAPVAARAGSVWAAVLEQHRALVDPRAAFSRLSILARFGRSLDAGMSRSWALFWASVSPEPEMGPHDSHLQSPRGTPFPDALAGSCAQGWHGLAAEIGSDGDGGAPAGKPDEAGEHTVKVWAGVVNVDPAAAGLVVPIVNTWPAHPALRPGASTSPTLRALVWGLGALCVILLTIIVVLSLIAQRQYARAQAAEAHVEKMALAGLSAAQTAATAGGDQRSRSNATTRPVSRSNEEAPTARSAENAWVEDADDILIAARAMQAQVRDMSPSPTPLSGEGRFLWPVQEGVTRREIP